MESKANGVKQPKSCRCRWCNQKSIKRWVWLGMFVQRVYKSWIGVIFRKMLMFPTHNEYRRISFLSISGGESLAKFWLKLFKSHNEQNLGSAVWSLIYLQTQYLIFSRSLGNIWNVRKFIILMEVHRDDEVIK